MKRVAVGCGVMVLLFVVVVAVAVGVSRYRSSVKSGTWLEVRLGGELLEYKPRTLVGALLLEDELLLRDVTDALDKAAEDPKILGLLVKIDSPAIGWARTQEIRDHVIAFRESGKPAVCFIETAGEFAPGNRDYYMATAFDTIYMPPSGDINLIGLMGSSLFLRGTLDWLGIYPELAHIGDYKTAMNMFTEKAFTAAHREMYLAILESLERSLVAGIADGRKMTDGDVRALFTQAPFLGKEALEARLVDGLKYIDEVHDELKEPDEEKLRTVKPRRYLKTGRPGTRGRKAIGVVYGVGAVLRGKSDMDPLSGEVVMGSDSVTRSLRLAAEDSSIKAIVFRVDSPGGSYVASDIIRREVVRAKEKKPVVVTMADVAGSGGYFVSMHANEIVAQPTTLTASIGVVGGKLHMRGFYNKIGLSKDHVSLQPYADMFYDYQRFTAGQREAHWRWLNRIYDDFSHKVAEGRGMEWEDVDRIGRGRVWTGEDAKRIGLVDHLGGLDVAIARAKELAEIPEDEAVRLKFFPKPKTVWEVLTSKDSEASTGVTLRSLDRLVAVVRHLVRAAGPAEEAVLMMPDTADIQ
jgi:protease-4